MLFNYMLKNMDLLVWCNYRGDLVTKTQVSLPNSRVSSLWGS